MIFVVYYIKSDLQIFFAFGNNRFAEFAKYSLHNAFISKLANQIW